MRVAIVSASHYGATAGIAERIGAELRLAGVDVSVYDARYPPHSDEIAGFDAFVVGSATYLGHWLKPATTFVHRHQPTLLEHPVWLFSSGPLGPADARTQADLEALVPAEITDFGRLVRPVAHRVFFGALDPDALSLAHRAVRAFPGATDRIPAGDFRHWPEIDAWGREIGRHLLIRR